MHKFFFLKLASILGFLMLAGVAVSSVPTSALAGDTVTVPRNVDVYDQPGGEGKPRSGFLKRKSQVTLLKQRSDHWCQVSGGAVPGGTGWVWCGMGDNGKDYSLKPVADTGGGGGAGGGDQDGGGKAEQASGPKLFHCRAEGVTGPGAGAYAEQDISAANLDDASSIYSGGLSIRQILFSAVSCTPKS
jgi:hypothetical protein